MKILSELKQMNKQTSNTDPKMNLLNGMNADMSTSELKAIDRMSGCNPSPIISKFFPKL